MSVGTTTSWPAASPEPVTCTSPSASSNSPSETATRWLVPSGADDLDRVAAAGLGQQRGHRHHQGVGHAGGGDADLHRGLIPRARGGRVGRGDVHGDGRRDAPELPDEQVSVPGAAELELDPPDPELDGQVATVPTEETTPGVVWLLGRVMVTLSPTATSVCCEASKATCTWRVVEVACSTVWPVWVLPPSWADRAVTRTAVGSNTAWPRVSVPFWVTPRAAWSFSTAVVVADPKEAEVGLS